MRRRQQPAGLTPAEPPQAPTGPQAADPPKGLNGPAAPPEPQHGGQMNLSNVVELPEAWKNKGNIGPEEPQKPKAPPSDPEDRKVYPLGMGAEKIVESIFSMPDSGEEYDDLNRLLKLEERFTSMSSGQQLDELERCQECVMRAMRLLAVVKAMAAEQEEHIEVVLSALKREALENLQSERSASRRPSRPPSRSPTTTSSPRCGASTPTSSSTTRCAARRPSAWSRSWSGSPTPGWSAGETSA